MSKIWVIIKREYYQVVRKKSFLIGILLTPVLMTGFVLLPTLLVRQEATVAERLAILDQSETKMAREFEQVLSKYLLEETDQPYYVVTAIVEIAVDDDSRLSVVRDSLRQAIIDQEIKYLLIIGPDPHLADSNLYLVTNSENFLSLRRFERELSSVLASRRLQMSSVNLEVDSVLSLTRRLDLAIHDAKGEAIPFKVKWGAAMVLVVIMFAMIFGYGQLVMRSVIEEKNSRIMEVMISSVSPFQLMLGKILGLGAATFTQLAIWVVLGAGLSFLRGSTIASSALDRIIFNPALVIFYVLFLVTGYLLFSTLFALIGSLVNTEKEAQSFVFPVTMTLMLPIIIGISIVQDPNSTLAVTLSMIPFLAPTMMIMRLVFVAPTLTSYSLFSGIMAQASIALILVMLSIVGMVWLTAKIFRVGILMYGKRPTLPEILKWIKY